ncbi:MAG TPA: MobQ family relaxase [Rhizomicrobium sp.]|jgi:hypothetical protein
MALYHFTAKAVSMGKGQSAVHTAAYNARCQLHDERENRDTKDYGYKGKTEFTGIFAPQGAPDWTHDREQLWNHATAAERQANGQPARNVEFALPHELNAEQRLRLVTDFARETFARCGMVADVSIHKPHDRNDDRNHHVHCLLTMRRLDGDSFAKTKERQWNSKEELGQWREKWAQMGARALERAGHPLEADRFRHGHKNLAGQREAALERGDTAWAQQCDKEAGIHKGAAVSAMEQRNDPRLVDNEKARECRGIEERNAARDDIRATEKELAAARQGMPPEQLHPSYAREPVTANPMQSGSWHQRDETKMEQRISGIQNAAERGGASVAAGLYAEGMTLARVDAAGRSNVERENLWQYENDRLQGKPDARRRQAPQEGELVAVNKRGDVFRLNPRFVELDKLERAATGGRDRTPTLSQAQQYFATERQRQRDDRAAAQEARKTFRAEERTYDRTVDAVKAAPGEAVKSGINAGFKVMKAGGATVALSSFVESLFGMGAASPPPRSPAEQRSAAYEAMESIYESTQRGEALSPSDVRNLPPSTLMNIRQHGDDYVREMIRDFEREKSRERDDGRGLER